MNFVLGNEGIAAMKAYLLGVQSALNSIAQEGTERVAEYGRQALERVAPTTDIDGNQPGSVFTEPSENGTRVVYSGDDVAYIEFGTGYIGENNPYPDESILGKANWVYDINKHGYKGWVYRRKRDGRFRHSRGMVPEAPVLTAFRETEKVAPQIIKEVINEKLGG